MTIPPPMKMYMSDVKSDGRLKKADSLPPFSSNDDGSMTTVFIHEDVRRSLRQRAPPLVAS